MKVLKHIRDKLCGYAFLFFVFCMGAALYMMNYAASIEDYDARKAANAWCPRWLIIGIVALVVFVVSAIVNYIYAKKPTNQSEVRNAIENKTLESNTFFTRYKATPEEFNKSNRDIDAANDLKEKLSYIIGTTPTCSMIEWGILAEEGKVPPRWRFKDAYNTPLVWANVADKWDYSDEKKITECWVKFLKWYDKELAKNGMGYPLLYAEYKGDKYDDGKLKFYAEDAKSIQECGENCTMPIAVFWEPVVRECSWKTLGGKISYWEFKYEGNN